MNSKTKVFFRRLKGMSFGRMFKQINGIHDDFGFSKIGTFADMVWCALHYKVGYLDYRTYGFFAIRGKKRKTFMTMSDNIEFTHKLNSKDCYELFDDKVKFNRRFKDFIGREWIDLNDCTFEDFKAFCGKRDVFFAKQPVSYGGLGVKKIDLSACPDLGGLYKSLKEEKLYLCEEAIVQHPDMSAVCPTSVNTVRVVTLLSSKNEPQIIYALMRMSSDGSGVDNISSGGMYAPVNDDGTITKPAFAQNAGKYYEKHPVTGVRINAFKVPLFDEVKALVRAAALVEPKLRYVGWDVAVTEKGPVLVEGNNFPSYDMIQTFMQTDAENFNGILPAFKEAMSK